MHKNATEFEWHATDSAPEGYPMEIRQGSFYYHDKSGSLYIPTGATLRSGWGQDVSRHVVGPRLKPLPDSFEIYFFSYTENQFYRGKFDLPYEEILSLFRAGVEENPERPTYNGITVGVAPGGAVSVWLKGFKTKEVFFGQAEKVNIDPSKGHDLPLDSKAEADAYTNEVLIDTVTPEQLASLKKNGVPFGTWARYRKLYKWIPRYKDGKTSSDKIMPVSLLNGEWDKIPTKFNEEMENTLRPLPRTLEFSVPIGNQSLFYIITFEEFELMDAFEKLGAHGEKVYIEFDAQAPRQLMKIRVHDDKQSIQLTKMHIKE
jgi:predicted DNA-binding WGR domain protein